MREIGRISEGLKKKEGNGREQEKYPRTIGFKVGSWVLHCLSITLVIVISILKHT